MKITDALRALVLTSLALGAGSTLLAAEPANACPMCHGAKDKKGHQTAEKTQVKDASPGEFSYRPAANPNVLHVATLSIKGMTCGGCSKGLERTLAGQKGVTEAKVSYKDANAQVTFYPKDTDAAKLAAVLSRDEQYTASVAAGSLAATTTLRVEGMTCGACAKNVKTALAKLKGFRAATVDVKAKKATVTFDPKQSSPSDIRKAISGAGYGASWLAPIAKGDKSTATATAAKGSG